MWIHKLPQIDNYYNNSFIFSNNIPSIISKNYFKLISFGLRINIKDTDLLSNEFLSEDKEDKEINSDKELNDEKENTTYNQIIYRYI